MGVGSGGRRGCGCGGSLGVAASRVWGQGCEGEHVQDRGVAGVGVRAGVGQGVGLGRGRGGLRLLVGS